ncbi:hypothetical protein BsWGS_03051 [Bradybaena similaris]
MGRHRDSRKLPPARCPMYYTSASSSQASSSTSQAGHSATRRPVVAGRDLNSQDSNSVSQLQYQYSAAKGHVSQAQKHELLSSEKVTTAHLQPGYTQVPSGSNHVYVHNSKTNPVSCVSSMSGIKTTQQPTGSQIFRGQKRKQQASSSKPMTRGSDFTLDLVTRHAESNSTWCENVLLMLLDKELLKLRHIVPGYRYHCSRKYLCLRRCG